VVLCLLVSHGGCVFRLFVGSFEAFIVCVAHGKDEAWCADGLVQVVVGSSACLAFGWGCGLGVVCL